MRLDLKNCSFAVSRPWVCEYGRSIAIFLYFSEGQSRSQGLTAFWYKLGCRKSAVSATIVIIDSDEALANQRNEGKSNTRGFTKCLYLDLSLQDLSILCIHFIYIFLTQNKNFTFRGPIKYFESAHPELSRSGDGKRTIF